MRIDTFEVNQAARRAPAGRPDSLLAMLSRSKRASFVLKRGALLPMPAAVGTEIRCDCGTVWITQDHDPRDIVLARDERFVLDVDQPALVQAFDFSVISVSAPLPSR